MIMNSVETIRDIEKEKLDLLSYTSYLDFLQIQKPEIERIRKRNLTQRRLNRLRTSTSARLSSRLPIRLSSRRSTSSAKRSSVRRSGTRRSSKRSY